MSETVLENETQETSGTIGDMCNFVDCENCAYEHIEISIEDKPKHFHFDACFSHYNMISSLAAKAKHVLMNLINDGRIKGVWR